MGGGLGERIAQVYTGSSHAMSNVMYGNVNLRKFLNTHKCHVREASLFTSARADLLLYSASIAIGNDGRVTTLVKDTDL